MYRALNISKQAVAQHLGRVHRANSQKTVLMKLISEIRKDHPTMGCRDMYYKIDPEEIGRDAFEDLCREEGLMSFRAKNYTKTTNSLGVTRFKNLIENIEIKRVNQVWQSDITYYEVNGIFYYITFIIDSFSKRIVGHQVSQRLYTECTTIASFKKALRLRKGFDLSGLIFHSDGGGQYYDKEFLALCKDNKIANSMCVYPWENGVAERVNGIIKNNYLVHKKITNFDELVKAVDRSVYLYNTEKPHSKLNRLTPIMFEKMLTFAQAKEKDDALCNNLKTSVASSHNSFYSKRNRTQHCQQKCSKEVEKLNKSISKNKLKTVNVI